MNKENYYITHVIVPEELPEEGLDQLFYYTTKDKTLKDGKFYWGRGKNSFNEDFIKKLLDKGDVQKINSSKYPILIKEDQTLLVDNRGNIYKTGSFLPVINKRKIGKLETEVKK